MARQKRKLTPKEKLEKKRRKEQYYFVFINGKQKRIKKPETIDGLSVDEFIRRNADPIWLHHNGYYDILHERWLQEYGDSKSTNDEDAEDLEYLEYLKSLADVEKSDDDCSD